MGPFLRCDCVVFWWLSYRLRISDSLFRGVADDFALNGLITPVGLRTLGFGF